MRRSRWGSQSPRGLSAVSIVHFTATSGCFSFFLLLFFLFALILSPGTVAASDDDLSAGRIAGIAVGTVCVFVLVGGLLAYVVWRQRRHARLRERARRYGDAELVTMDEVTGQQPGQEQASSGTPQQQQQREGADGDDEGHSTNSDDAERHTDDVDVTISGVPIENRVRPRRRPPKGTVIVRHEDRQIRINFSQLPDIPEAAPPPLTAEELQRLEDEQNRVASPEFYGRSDYMERPDTPGSPLEHFGSFSSFYHLSRQLAAARAGSNYAASNASDCGNNSVGAAPAHKNRTRFFPNSPSAGSLHGYLSAGGTLRLSGLDGGGGGGRNAFLRASPQSHYASSVDSRKDSFPDLVVTGGGNSNGGVPQKRRSSLLAGVGGGGASHSSSIREDEHSSSNGASRAGDGPLPPMIAHGLGHVPANGKDRQKNGPTEANARREARMNEQRERRAGKRAGRRVGGADSMESTSDDFEDHENAYTPNKAVFCTVAQPSPSPLHKPLPQPVRNVSGSDVSNGGVDSFLQPEQQQRHQQQLLELAARQPFQGQQMNTQPFHSSGSLALRNDSFDVANRSADDKSAHISPVPPPAAATIAGTPTTLANGGNALPPSFFSFAASPVQQQQQQPQSPLDDLFEPLSTTHNTSPAVTPNVTRT